jgi:hypothetical protein
MPKGGYGPAATKPEEAPKKAAPVAAKTETHDAAGHKHKMPKGGYGPAATKPEEAPKKAAPVSVAEQANTPAKLDKAEADLVKGEQETILKDERTLSAMAHAVREEVRTELTNENRPIPSALAKRISPHQLGEAKDQRSIDFPVLSYERIAGNKGPVTVATPAPKKAAPAKEAAPVKEAAAKLAAPATPAKTEAAPVKEVAAAPAAPAKTEAAPVKEVAAATKPEEAPKKVVPVAAKTETHDVAGHNHKMPQGGYGPDLASNKQTAENTSSNKEEAP